METKLWQIFNNVNRWLEYAEKKNAIVMTFIGIQLTIGKFFVKKPDTLLIIGIGFLALGFFIIMFSFIPKFTPPKWLKFMGITAKKKNPMKDNLLFYGDIVKYSVTEYCNAMEIYLDGKVKGNKLFEDLCEQIVTNSCIAYAKYKFFKIATWFLFVGQMFFITSFCF